MADIQEAIHIRLEEIVQAVDGFTTAGRNYSDLEDDDLPAIVSMDGEEEALELDEAKRRSPGIQPRIMIVRPVVTMVLLGKREELGPQASDLRARIVNAVTTDATLKGLCLNGRMSYEGYKRMPSTGGRGNLLSQGLTFTFTYVFRPQDLGPGSA